MGGARVELRRRLEQLHPEAWAWAIVCCQGDDAEARDVLQSIYVSILEGRMSFAGRSTFKTWLFGVVRRSAFSRRRRVSRRLALLERWVRERGERRGDDPQAGLEREERGARVRAALGRLSQRQRQVIELAFYHDLSLSEVAEVVGVSLGSVKTHYDRGKRELRRLLENEREQ